MSYSSLPVKPYANIFFSSKRSFDLCMFTCITIVLLYILLSLFDYHVIFNCDHLISVRVAVCKCVCLCCVCVLNHHLSTKGQRTQFLYHLVRCFLWPLTLLPDKSNWTYLICFDINQGCTFTDPMRLSRFFPNHINYPMKIRRSHTPINFRSL